MFSIYHFFFVGVISVLCKLLSALFSLCIFYVLFLSVSLTLCVCMFVCPRAQSYAERLRLGLAVIHGEAHHSESDMADGRHSPPLSRAITGHTGLELPCKINGANLSVSVVVAFLSFFFFLEALMVIYRYYNFTGKGNCFITNSVFCYCLSLEKLIFIFMLIVRKLPQAPCSCFDSLPRDQQCSFNV